LIYIFYAFAMEILNISDSWLLVEYREEGHILYNNFVNNQYLYLKLND